MSTAPATLPRGRAIPGVVQLTQVVAVSIFLPVSIAVTWGTIADRWVESVFTVICVALCLPFRIRISWLDRNLSFGVSGAILGFSAPAGDRLLEALAVWAIGLLIGLLIQYGDAILALSAMVGLLITGYLFLATWELCAELGLGYLALPVSVLVYMLVGLTLNVLVSVATQGIGVGELLGSLMTRRVIQAFVVLVAVCFAGRYIGGGLDDLIPALGVSLGSVITLTLIGAVFFALAMLIEARTARARLSGVIAAAEDLPWPEDADPFDRIRRYTAATVVSDRVEIRAYPPRAFVEIGSALITPGGDDLYLVARRRAGRAPFLDQDLRALSAIAHIGSETMRVRSETIELENEANTDPLTRLPNYRAFQQALSRANSQRLPGSALAVVYIDLDNFKSINDVYGHETGNQVLRIFADRLRAVVRPSDTVARVGGDEFVIILTDVTSQEHAGAVSDRIARSISAPINLSGERVLALTISTGVAYSDEVQSDPSTLIEEADVRMYSSRGRSLASSPGHMPTTSVSEVEAADLVSIVSSAIDNGELQVAYQPVIDNVAGTIVGLEALVRFEHPTHGPILPSLLVHEARRLGRLDDLTRQVLAHAFEDLVAFQKLAPQLTSVHVNIEVDQVLDSGFLDRIGDMSAEHPGVGLTLEMTENSLNRSSVEVMTALEALRERGVSLALDDFGQAYSTMFAIVQYPFDILKLDRVMIQELDEPKAQLVIRSLALLVRKLDVQMIVEGVETQQERDQLARLGVRYMQGYFFGRPMSAEKMTAMLAEDGLTSALAGGPVLSGD